MQDHRPSSGEILWYGAVHYFQDIAASVETNSDFLKFPPIDSAFG